MSKGRVDGRNYVRNTIIALVKFNKLIVVDASYAGRAWLCEDETLDKLVFTDIRPYVPKEYFTHYLCNHMTFEREKVLAEFDFSALNLKQRFVLICKPYIYNDYKGNGRGGLGLEKIEGLPTVISKELAPEYKEYLETNKIFDFLGDSLNQPYAWLKSEGGYYDKRPKQKEEVSTQEKFERKRMISLVSSRKTKSDKQKEKEALNKKRKMINLYLSPNQSVFHKNPTDITGIRKDYLEFLEEEGNNFDNLLKKMHENDNEILRKYGKPKESDSEEEFWLDSYDDESR